MLLRFSVSNQTSIAERQEISLVASSLREGSETALFQPLSGTTKVLPCAILYGANASGKSNFLDAIVDMRNLALNSHKRNADDHLPYSPFKLSQTHSQRPTAYEIDFVVGDTHYEFGFEFTADLVVAEWLSASKAGRRAKLYERQGASITFGRSLKGRNRLLADLMRPNSLFFSVAYQNAHEQITEIGSFFRELIATNSVEVHNNLISASLRVASHASPQIIDFLKEIGTGIVSYRHQTVPASPEAISFQKDFYALMKSFAPSAHVPKVSENIEQVLLEHEAEDGAKVAFDPDEESLGTRRLLNLMGGVFLSLENGSLMVVDELDASVHTQACELIIRFFTNPVTNPKGAQLVASTHDTNLMNSNILRRDQIWFVRKNKSGYTQVYPLTDIRVRKGDNIERGYLQGRFGAVPSDDSATSIVDAEHTSASTR